MPIAKKWSHYTKANVQSEPDNYGVYELGNTSTGEVLYIGEGHIRSRLLAHLPDGTRTHENVVGADGYRYELTGGKEKAEQGERALLKAFKAKNGRLPKYNQQHP